MRQRNHSFGDAKSEAERDPVSGLALLEGDYITKNAAPDKQIGCVLLQ